MPCIATKKLSKAITTVKISLICLIKEEKISSWITHSSSVCYVHRSSLVRLCVSKIRTFFYDFPRYHWVKLPFVEGHSWMSGFCTRCTTVPATSGVLGSGMRDYSVTRAHLRRAGVKIRSNAPTGFFSLLLESRVRYLGYP